MVFFFARLGAPEAHLGTTRDRLWTVKALTFQLLCCFLEFSAAEQPKCDFEQPSLALARFCQSWGGQVESFWAPGAHLGALYG